MPVGDVPVAGFERLYATSGQTAPCRSFVSFFYPVRRYGYGWSVVVGSVAETLACTDSANLHRGKEAYARHRSHSLLFDDGFRSMTVAP